MFKLNLIFGAPPRSTGWYYYKWFRRLGIDCEQFDNNSHHIRNADFNLVIDCGAYLSRNDIKHPNGYLAIDNYSVSARHIQIIQALNADVVFVAQKNTIRTICSLIGFACPPLIWLPNACDPEIHINNNSNWHSRNSLCGFIGSVEQSQIRDRRSNILDIAQSIDKTSKIIRQNDFPHTKMYEVMSDCKIGINECSIEDWNMRAFENCSYGCLLLTNYIVNNGIEELGFEDQVNCIFWNNIDDFKVKLERIKRGLNEIDNSVYYYNIARNGYLLSTRSHTYEQRCLKILAEINR